MLSNASVEPREHGNNKEANGCGGNSSSGLVLYNENGDERILAGVDHGVGILLTGDSGKQRFIEAP